jgi:hypothetical protein
MNSINSCSFLCEFIQYLNSLKFDSPKLPPIAQKKKRRGKKKTKAANPAHKEKIKRKQLLEEIDAADEDFIPDGANRKEPPENFGKKNQKDPPETIEDRNSYAIISPADLKSKTNSNDGYSNGGVNTMLSLPFLADEVDDKEPKCQAFVAINYAPKIEGIGTYMHFFPFNLLLMLSINLLLYSRSLYSYFI